MKKKKSIRRIVLMVLFGCVFCVGTALLIGWRSGRNGSRTCVLAGDTKPEEKESEQISDVEHGSQKVLPQWLFYESVGGDDCGEEEKAYLDLLVNRWTNGKLTDDELSEQMTDYLVKKGMTISTMGVQSQMLCLFPSAQGLPDYTQILAGETGTYDFIGVYTNGEYDEEGSLLCYYWEAGVRSV
jgi:hypothetical protein